MPYIRVFIFAFLLFVFFESRAQSYDEINRIEEKIRNYSPKALSNKVKEFDFSYVKFNLKKPIELFEAAYAFMQNGNYTDAIPYFEYLKSLGVKEIGMYCNKRVISCLLFCYVQDYENHKTSKLKLLLDEFISFCQDGKCTGKEMANAYADIGRKYLLDRNYLKANLNLKKAIDFYNKVNVRNYSSRTDYATTLHHLNKPNEALREFFEIREDAKKDSVWNGYTIPVWQNHIGFILYRLELYDYAKPYLDSTEVFYRSIKSPYYLAAILTSQAELQIKKKNFKQAQDYLIEAEKLTDANEVYKAGNIYKNFIRVYTEFKNFDKGEKYFNKAKNYFTATNDSIGLADTFSERSYLYLKRQQYDSAIYYGKMADNIYKEGKVLRERVIIRNTLSEAYFNTSNFNALEESRKVSDSILNYLESNSDIASIIQIINDYDDSNRNNTKLTNTTSSLNRKLRIIVLVFGTLSVMGIAVWSRNRHKKNDQKLTTEKENKKSKTYKLKNTEAEDLLAKVKVFMISEKPYLDKELTLSKLSEACNTSNKKLSILFSQHLNTNFYDFVNEYRIEGFLKYIEENAEEKFSILGIAFSCGFKNKGSFYRSFKKFKGMTPKEFIDKIAQKS